MEIKRSKLNIKYEGQQFPVAFPSFGKLCDYQDEMKSIDANKEPKKVYELTGRFLHGLGLPKEVYAELEPSHVEGIMGAFNHKKK